MPEVTNFQNPISRNIERQPVPLLLQRDKKWERIAFVTFHDLRHDFAHRARAAGWSLEELAYYLGHVAASGAPAIQTTIRYTQVSRDQVKPKLRALQG